MPLTRAGLRLLGLRMAGADVQYDGADVYATTLSVSSPFDAPSVPNRIASATYTGHGTVREGAWSPAICSSIFKATNEGVQSAVAGKSYAIFMRDESGVRTLTAWANYDMGTIPAAGGGAWSLSFEHAYRFGVEELASVVLGINGRSVDANNQIVLRAVDIQDSRGSTLEDIARNVVREVSRRTVSVPGAGWTTNAQGWSERTIDVAGTVSGSATQRVDVAVTGAQIGNVLLAGARVDANGKLTLVCLSTPPAAFSLEVVISEVIS